MGDIAFLGWGSLCWNPGTLPIVGEWRRGGPIIPLEFSRVSMDGRLTLVLDPSGVPCETRLAWSGVNTLAEAVRALCEREGTVLKWVGYRDGMGGGSSIERYPEQPNVDGLVASWIVDQTDGASAAVWTALPSNFVAKTQNEFSVENAIAYLDSLDAESLDKALEYITRAPVEVQTPVRAAAMARWRLSG